MRDGRRNGKEEREGEQKKKEGGKNLVETRSKEKNWEQWLGAYNKNSLSLTASDITNHLSDIEAYVNSSEIIYLSLICSHTPL